MLRFILQSLDSLTLVPRLVKSKWKATFASWSLYLSIHELPGEKLHWVASPVAIQSSQLLRYVSSPFSLIRSEYLLVADTVLDRSDPKVNE